MRHQGRGGGLMLLIRPAGPVRSGARLSANAASSSARRRGGGSTEGQPPRRPDDFPPLLGSCTPPRVRQYSTTSAGGMRRWGTRLVPGVPALVSPHPRSSSPADRNWQFSRACRRSPSSVLAVIARIRRQQDHRRSSMNGLNLPPTAPHRGQRAARSGGMLISTSTQSRQMPQMHSVQA